MILKTSLFISIFLIVRFIVIEILSRKLINEIKNNDFNFVEK